MFSIRKQQKRTLHQNFSLILKVLLVFQIYEFQILKKYYIFENPLLTHRFRYKMSSGWYSDLLTCTTSLVEIWVRYPHQLVIL